VLQDAHIIETHAAAAVLDTSIASRAVLKRKGELLMLRRHASGSSSHVVLPDDEILLPALLPQRRGVLQDTVQSHSNCSSCTDSMQPRLCSLPLQQV
jgi:hypothetical protein